ncbi:MAG: riboflavin kinase/FMN adenylyltransferase, partial [Candidatus Krumholzibacteriia bacterium]
MRLIRLTAEYIDELIADRIGNRGPQLESCSLTLGSFDGLHRGHMALIDKVRTSRDSRGLAEAAIFTFMQHPRTILDPAAKPFLLTTWREKLSVLHDCGCEVVVAADFCPALSELPYDDFVAKFLVRYLGMKHLVAGHDVHLGADRGGTVDSLAALGEELDFSFAVLPPVLAGGEVISSSAIRKAVLAGDMPKANKMLGRPYALWGEVTPGDRRGREIGYPTANIMPLDEMKLLPESGVYAVRVQVPGDVVGAGCAGEIGRVNEALPEVDSNGDLLSVSSAEWVVFDAMLNFGYVPTFHGEGLPERRIEAHLFGFEGDLRGRNVKVEWIERLRGEKKFAGVDELVAQLVLDQVSAQAAL